MEFYIPTETGEFLAFCAAAVTSLIGLLFLFAPGIAYRAVGIDLRKGGGAAMPRRARPWAAFISGLVLQRLLLAQPMVYLALGAAFALAAFGRILSMLSDSGNTVVNWLLLTVQIVLAALPLAYVFGFV